MGELRPNCTLNQRVRLQVDGGGGLVQDENVGFSKQRPSQADQLTLTHAEVLAALGDDVGEAISERVDKRLQVGQLQHSPQLVVRLVAKGVEVLANGATEENRLLGDDGDARAERLQAC